MKPKTLIVYEDNVADLAQAAKAMIQIAKASGVSAQLSSASSVTIAQTLAANLLVFGAKSPESTAYSELRRLFMGINLAGRKAAFFHAHDPKGVEVLKASLKDTDILLHSTELDISSNPDASTAWIKAAMDL